MSKCKFCYNCYVWANEAGSDEFVELDNTNDFSSISIGNCKEGHKMYFNSGNGESCNIELCEWGEDNRWHPVGKYYPKYCPECGRLLDEFVVNE